MERICAINNKSRIIAMFFKKLKDYKICYQESTSDADTLILTTAIEKSSSDRIVIVGKDVESIVFLIALTLFKRHFFH